MTESVEDAEALTDAIAAKPAAVTADSVSVTQRTIAEQIAYENHVRNRAAAAASGGIGVRFFKTKPPGAT